MKREVLLSPDQPELGSALRRAMEMEPADIAFEVREAKLLGRGGAGFPAGVKWVLAGGASGAKKYVICNADEGEPGTFKDRVLIERYADRLLEGMAIAGYAIGSDEGIIYLRAEYPYLVPVIEEARSRMLSGGLLGKNLFGGRFSFDVEVRMGSGAYVCGEETALLESLEGRRGEPRNKPPYPVNSGYRGCPTIINNVETFITVPHIILNGAEWFRGLGEDGDAGTKLFSISGDVERPGVYELAMGSTIGELLDLAGAVDIQAVQVGGASGRTIRGDQLDRKLSFRDLPPGGSVIVFNGSRNMLEVLRNFSDFFVHESCGQCTPCREGNRQLRLAVGKILEGEFCCRRCLDSFFELASVMKDTSKCGFGQTSANCFVDIVGGFLDLPEDCSRVHEQNPCHEGR
ncbi:iron hydrogenase [Candidatus Fermentibacteria bacterium]|nr:iron hydrogenase [Candidatus Fermentibacteria bacterium]